MRRIRQIRRLVLHVSCERVRLVTARERLVQRRRLDDALVGELLVRGRDDGQSGGRFAARCPGGFHGSEGAGAGHLLGAVDGRVAGAGGLLQPRLDDVTLLLADGDAALELLAHCGVLGHEAGGEAGEPDVLDGEAAGFARGERRGAFLVRVGGARVVLGEVEFARPVARRGEAGRGGLFLDDDLGRWGISDTARGMLVKFCWESYGVVILNIPRWRAF